MPTDRKIICMTPCKNEAWLMENFLACTSLWADHIICLDQMSDDGTRDIIKRFPKAILVDNRSVGHNAGERYRQVLEHARRIPGNNLLLAVDADECWSANFFESAEWQEMLQLPPGTTVYAEWENLTPDMNHAWKMNGVGHHFPMGYVDDGKLEYSPGLYHMPRILSPEESGSFYFRDVRLLHFQYVDHARSKSKNRYYQYMEFRDNPRYPLWLCRKYNPTAAVPDSAIHRVDEDWFAGYQERGINLRKVHIDGKYRWDKEMLLVFQEKGTAPFRKLNVWDVDWASLAKAHGVDAPGGALDDPRSRFEKLIHLWIERTNSRMSKFSIRLQQNLLRVFGW